MRIDQRRWTDIKHERATCREAALRLFCRAPAQHVEWGLKTLAQCGFPPEMIAQAIQEREGRLAPAVPASGPIESAMARAGQDLDLVLDYNPWIAQAWQTIGHMPQRVAPYWGTVAHWSRRVLNGLASVIDPCGASRAGQAGTGTPSRPLARQRPSASKRSGQADGMLGSPAPSNAVKPRRRNQIRPP
jgi:hypothetical protein